MQNNEDKLQQKNQSQFSEQPQYSFQTFQQPSDMPSVQFVHYQQIQNPEFNQKLYKPVSYWRIWLISFAFLAIHFVVLSLSGILAGIIKIATNPVRTPEEIMNLLMTADVQNWACVFMGIICIPIYLVFLKKRNNKYRGSLGWHKLRAGSVSSMIVAAFGSLGLVTGLLLLLQELSKNVAYIDQKLQEYQKLSESIVSSESNIILQIAATAIIVPIAEELLFRGIVLGELNFRYSPRTVVLIQAVLFGLFHMNFVQSLYTFIPGLLLGIAYYYTGNIIVPIIMHMTFNLFGGVLSVFMSESVLNYLTYIELAVGLFSLIIIIIFFIKVKPDTKHKLQWEHYYPYNV
ncbi:MAG TPA: CPBP family intramembrane metalloprotease [Clostridiaceae bacterium]|nr:CPBP family intramembrane metalloprotease [Clostridiaceae bacterium]